MEQLLIALLGTDKQNSILRRSGTCWFSYTVFGYDIPANSALSRLGFNGQLRTTVTGNYLLGNGHRTYSPALMRFMSPDSLSPFGQGDINAYAYCSGEPVNYRDDSGRNRSPSATSPLTQFLHHETHLPDPLIHYKNWETDPDLTAKEKVKIGKLNHYIEKAKKYSAQFDHDIKTPRKYRENLISYQKFKTTHGKIERIYNLFYSLNKNSSALTEVNRPPPRLYYAVNYPIPSSHDNNSAPSLLEITEIKAEAVREASPPPYPGIAHGADRNDL